MAFKIAIIAGAAGAVGFGIAGVLVGHSGSGNARLLAGDDFGQLRHEALGLFPRGEPVARVEEGLKDLGFQCAPRHRPMPNINAASVECDSAGRGYPGSSRVEVTVLGRNGAVSDIAVSNGMSGVVADAHTPDPTSQLRAVSDAADL